MIEATHNRLADVVFKRYLNHLFRRHFASLNLIGDAPHIPENLPVLILPNHNTWWDGFFVYHLNRIFFQRRLYMMMLEEQLSRYPFFRRIGAYGIIPNKVEDVRKSISYTAKLLEGTDPEGVALCVFPQGELVSWYQQPITYQRGIEVIIRRTKRPVSILPLLMRIEYIEMQYPQVFFMFGEPEIMDPTMEIKIEHYARKAKDLRDKLRRELIKKNYGNTILSGRPSAHN
jgi:1-acyl-sn-glycerol-3-phosphate acyltransferase